MQTAKEEWVLFELEKDSLVSCLSLATVMNTKCWTRVFGAMAQGS